jgi:hypothetical protein
LKLIPECESVNNKDTQERKKQDEGQLTDDMVLADLVSHAGDDR